MTREEFFAGIIEEREHQEQEGFTREHDQHHDINYWLRLLMQYLGKAATDADIDGPLVRHRLIQMAAIVCAAMEVYEGD